MFNEDWQGFPVVFSFNVPIKNIAVLLKFHRNGLISIRRGFQAAVDFT